MSSPEFVPRLHGAERFHIGGSRTAYRVRSSFWSHSARVAVFWALCDIFCGLVRTTAAIRMYLGNFTSDESVFQTQSMLSASPWLSLFYLCWFILSLILVSRRMHLYAPIQLRNTLHDQRLTIQACLTAGLLLSGALYLGRGQEISRGVVTLTIAFTAVLICARRLVWRAVVYRRYDRGIETRNILVIGTGRVGQALRHHIESIRHLGFSFKGFVHVPGYESEADNMEVLGTIDEVLELARKHFVDEIFVTAPCERVLVKRLVNQAREAGVDIRIVPDLY